MTDREAMTDAERIAEPYWQSLAAPRRMGALEIAAREYLWLWDKRHGLGEAAPHPRPLPRGEGASLKASATPKAKVGFE